jgi:hypothetical protein
VEFYIFIFLFLLFIYLFYLGQIPTIPTNTSMPWMPHGLMSGIPPMMPTGPFMPTGPGMMMPLQFPMSGFGFPMPKPNATPFMGMPPAIGPLAGQAPSFVRATMADNVNGQIASGTTNSLTNTTNITAATNTLVTNNKTTEYISTINSSAPVTTSSFASTAIPPSTNTKPLTFGGAPISEDMLAILKSSGLIPLEEKKEAKEEKDAFPLQQTPFTLDQSSAKVVGGTLVYYDELRSPEELRASLYTTNNPSIEPSATVVTTSTQ